MDTLEVFSAWVTGGSLNGCDIVDNKIVFYGNFAPQCYTLREFCKLYEKFLCEKKYHIKIKEDDKNG